MLFALVVLVGFVRRIATHYTITTAAPAHPTAGSSPRRQQTRLERVQNVNTEPARLERILRVGTVDFDTAGTDDSDFTFSGIANPDEVVAAVDRAQREARPRARAPTACDGERRRRRRPQPPPTRPQRD